MRLRQGRPPTPLDLPLGCGVYRNGVRIELLYFDGCPNWEVAAERLDGVLADRRLTARRVVVDSEEQGAALGFRGSPTILIDGADPFARGDEPFGFACRVYDTPDGLAGAPTVEQLRDAIDRHVEEER